MSDLRESASPGRTEGLVLVLVRLQPTLGTVPSRLGSYAVSENTLGGGPGARSLLP